MGRKEFIEAWNQAFFTENGELNGATLDVEVAMAFPGGTVRFAVQGVTPKTRINELARTYAGSLPEAAAIQPPEPEAQPDTPAETPEAPPASLKEMIQEAAEPPQSPTKEVVANEHITYRQNRYLVQHYRLDGVDHYNIFNEGSGKVISASSVTGRSVLKEYREGQNNEVVEPVS